MVRVVQGWVNCSITVLAFCQNNVHCILYAGLLCILLQILVVCKKKYLLIRTTFTFVSVCLTLFRNNSIKSLLQQKVSLKSKLIQLNLNYPNLVYLNNLSQPKLTSSPNHYSYSFIVF